MSKLKNIGFDFDDAVTDIMNGKSISAKVNKWYCSKSKICWFIKIKIIIEGKNKWRKKY